MDLLNSQMKVTGKYYGSYLCRFGGGIIFFLPFWQHLSFSFHTSVIPERCLLLILPVFKAVIKWSLLDFREMIMVPKMTGSDSW